MSDRNRNRSREAASTADPNPILCIVYKAKSSDDIGNSLERQERKCRQAIEKEGGREVVAVYGDERKSGWKGNRGPGLAEARAHAKRLVAQGDKVELWVYHTTRLARGVGEVEGDADHLVDYRVAAKKARYRIRSATNDAAFQSWGATGQQGDADMGESESRSTLTKDGIDDRVYIHRLPSGGRATYGYRVVKRAMAQLLKEAELGRPLTNDEKEATRGWIEADPETIEVRRRIHLERALGVSQRQIARKLNTEGIASPKGGRWLQGRISDLLHDRTVLGEVKYNGKWYPGTHEPIVDRDVWEAAHAQLGRAPRASHGRPNKKVFLARGRAWCGICGGRLRTHSGHDTYYCGTRADDINACPMPPVKRIHVDPRLLTAYEQAGLDWEATLARMRAANGKDAQKTEATIQRGEAQLGQLVAARAERKADAKLGRLSAESWEEFRAEFDQEIVALAGKDGSGGQIGQLRERLEAQKSEAAVAVTEGMLVAYLDEVRRVIRTTADGDGLESVRDALGRLDVRFTLRPAGDGPFWAETWLPESDRCIDITVANLPAAPIFTGRGTVFSQTTADGERPEVNPERW